MDVKEPIRLLEVFFSNVLTLSIFIQGCLIISCLNDGSCLPDNEKQTFSCSCQQPWTGDRCEVKKGKFKTYLLTLETSASESLYGGQFSFSTQLVTPAYLVILPPTQHHSFFRNLPRLFICLYKLYKYTLSVSFN